MYSSGAELSGEGRVRSGNGMNSDDVEVVPTVCLGPHDGTVILFSLRCHGFLMG